MTVMINDTETYTVASAAEAAQRARKTIYRAIEDGKLAAVRSGWGFVITRPDLQAYLDRYVNRHVELP